MSIPVGSIYYEVDARTQGLLDAERQVDRSTKNMENGFGRADKSVKNLVGSLGELKTIVAAVGSAMAVQQVVQYADAWTAATNKIRIVSDTQDEFNDSLERTFSIAQSTRSSFQGTVDLYTKLARTNRTLKRSQEEVYRVTEIVSKAVALSGASAQAAEGAVTQFAQALSGNFSAAGQEINSILEQTPGLAEAIAKGLGTTSDQLKLMGEAGELSTQIVFEALLDVGDYIDGEFNKTIATFGQNWQKASDNMMRFVGESQTVTTVVRASGEAIVLLSENIGTIANVAGLAAGVVGVKLAGALLASANAQVKKNIASLAGAKADAEAARASALVAQREVRRAAAEQYTEKRLLGRAIAEARATRGTDAHSSALTRLGAARQRAIAAGTQYAAATRAAAAATATATAAASRASVAVRGLSSAMALFGGPAGVAVLAAGALYIYREELGLTRRKAGLTTDELEKLRGEIDDLSEAALNNRLDELSQDLEEATLKAASARQELASLKSEQSDSGFLGFGGGEVGAEVRGLQAVAEAQERIKEINQEIAETRKALDSREGGDGSGDGDGGGGGGGSSETKAAEQARKRLDALRKSLETERETIEREYAERNQAILDLMESGSQEQIQALHRSEKKYQEALESLGSQYQGLIDEIYPVKAAQREFREEMERLELAHQIGLIDDLADAQHRLRASMRNDQNWDEVYGFDGKSLEHLKQTRDTAEDLGLTFSSAFEDAIVGGEGFREVLAGITEDIARLAVRKSITEPAAGWLSTAFTTGLAAFGGGTGSAGTYGGGQLGNLYGFSSGGYTGNGGRNEIAGVVHGGEYVVPKNVVDQPGMRNYLEQLSKTRGYLKGGYVGGGNSGGSSLSTPGVSINVNAPITVQAGPGVSNADAQRQGRQMGQAIKATVIQVIQEQKRQGGILAKG